MTKIALVVVDAWDTTNQDNIDDYFLLEDEYNSFIKYLSFVTHYESLKKDVDIYHCHGSENRISNIFYEDNTNFVLLKKIIDIPLHYDYYLFCGFHYQMCVFKNIIMLSKYIDISRMGIVFNLTSTVPEIHAENLTFDYENVSDYVEHALDQYDGYDFINYDKHTFYNIKKYYWTRSGYRMIEVACV